MRRDSLSRLMIVAYLCCCSLYSATIPRFYWFRDVTSVVSGAIELNNGPDGSVYFSPEVIHAFQKSVVGRFATNGTLIFSREVLPPTELTTYYRSTSDIGGNLVLLRAGDPIAVAKISPSGELVWSITIRNTAFVTISGLACDSAGNIYLAGALYSDLDFGEVHLSAERSKRSAMIIKCTPDGAPLWGRTYGGDSSARSITVDPLDNLWVSPDHGIIPPGTFVPTVDRYSPSGVSLLSFPYPGVDFVAPSDFEPLAARTFIRALTNASFISYENDFEIARFATNGGVLSTWNYAPTGFADFYRFKSDAQFSTYFLGTFHDPAATFAGNAVPANVGALFLAKLEPNGALSWSRSLTNLFDSGRHVSLAVSGENTLYLSGGYSVPNHFDSLETAQFASGGLYIARLAPLVKNTPPLITGQPADLDLVEYGLPAATLLVGAAAVAPLEYQWFFNSEPVAGATNASIWFFSVPRTVAGEYRVRVRNEFGEAISSAAQVRVHIPPAIVSSPTDVTVRSGESVNFSVTAIGEGHLYYQWKTSLDRPIAGETNSTLVLSNVTFFDRADYFVEVTNKFGSALTRAGYLEVLSAPLRSGTNDLFPPQVAGSNLFIFSHVTGSAPISFQWYEGNQPMYGYTNYFLRLASNYSAGPFYAIASNAFGAVTSDVFTVQMMFPPTVIQSWQTNNWVLRDLKVASDGSLYTLRQVNATRPSEPTSVSRHSSATLLPEWTVPIRGQSSYARALATDNETNVYIIGDYTVGFKFGDSFLSATQNMRKAFLAQVSPTGGVERLKAFGEAPTNQAVKLHFKGNYFWTGLNLFGRRTNAQGNILTLTNAGLTRLDLQGNVEASFMLGAFPSPSPVTNLISAFTLNDFAVDSETNFFLAGDLWFLNPNGIARLPVAAKVNDLGETVWSRGLLPAGERPRFSFKTVTALAVDSQTNIYVAGDYGRDRPTGFIVKFNSGGDELWRKELTTFCCNGNLPFFQALEVESNGRVRVTGYAQSFLELGTDSYPPGGFVIELTKDGALNWHVNVNGSATTLYGVQTSGNRLFTAGATDLGSLLVKGLLVEVGAKVPSFRNEVRQYVVSSAEKFSIRPLLNANGPVAYQWYLNQRIVPEETSSFLNLDPRVNRPGMYQLVAVTPGGSITNDPISVGYFDSTFNQEFQPALRFGLPEAQKYRLEYTEQLGESPDWRSVRSVTGTGAVEVEVLAPSQSAPRIYLRLIPE